MQKKRFEWTDEQIQRFWDYESQFPENYFTNQVGENIVIALEKYLYGKERILDYGCGMGFLLSSLLKHGYKVTAMDFSRKSVEEVREKYINAENFFGAYYFEDLLKTQMKFDAIMVLEVLEHLNDFYLDVTMENLKVLLENQDGIVVFTTPNDEDLSKSNIYCPFCDSIFHRWQHVRSWNRESLREFLISHEFEVIDIYDTNFSQNPTTKRIWKKHYVKHFIKKIYGFLCKSKKEISANPHLVCIARKSKIV